jgi:phosphoribosylamine-glycine ligase
MGKIIAEAGERVYNDILRMHLDGCHYRKDIVDIKESSWML